jgi:ketosteroid isomerase-like protein
MSQENVEIVHQIVDAINREDIDGLLELMDPEVVAIPRILAVEGGVLRGHDGIRTWWDGIFTTFASFQIEVIAVRTIGDVTVSRLDVHGRGRESGAPFEDAVWLAARAREGKSVWWQTCRSEAEALEALGLRE